jgi:hypothetical protein
MKKHRLILLGALIVAAAAGGPALALDNPVIVDLQAVKGEQPEGSATIFGSGPSVLVNVTVGGGVPKAAAITLNDGDCANPGSIAFALSGLSENQSLTKLAHSLSEVAGKAKSLVIHQTSSLTSPAFACGKVTD